MKQFEDELQFSGAQFDQQLETYFRKQSGAGKSVSLSARALYDRLHCYTDSNLGNSKANSGGLVRFTCDLLIDGDAITLKKAAPVAEYIRQVIYNKMRGKSVSISVKGRAKASADDSVVQDGMVFDGGAGAGAGAAALRAGGESESDDGLSLLRKLNKENGNNSGGGSQWKSESAAAAAAGKSLSAANSHHANSRSFNNAVSMTSSSPFDNALVFGAVLCAVVFIYYLYRSKKRLNLADNQIGNNGNSDGGAIKSHSELDRSLRNSRKEVVIGALKLMYEDLKRFNSSCGNQVFCCFTEFMTRVSDLIKERMGVESSSSRGTGNGTAGGYDTYGLKQDGGFVTSGLRFADLEAGEKEDELKRLLSGDDSSNNRGVSRKLSKRSDAQEVVVRVMTRMGEHSNYSIKPYLEKMDAAGITSISQLECADLCGILGVDKTVESEIRKEINTPKRRPPPNKRSTHGGHAVASGGGVSMSSTLLSDLSEDGGDDLNDDDSLMDFDDDDDDAFGFDIDGMDDGGAGRKGDDLIATGTSDSSAFDDF